MRCYRIFLSISLLILLPFLVKGEEWPCTIAIKNGNIVIYQPEPQSFKNNLLSAIAAVSINLQGKDPVFGAIWINAMMSTDRDSRMVTLESLTIGQVKFPDGVDTSRMDEFKHLLETELPKHNYEVALDKLLAELDPSGNYSADTYKNDPPKIIFEENTSLLVFIDGDPKFERDEKLGLDKLVNSPYFMVNWKKKHYLYVGGRWFQSSSVTSGWTYDNHPPKPVSKIEHELNTGGNKISPIPLDSLPKIVVSLVPAELIQSSGKPSFAPVTGANLLYMSNSNDNIFMDIASQDYYVLLSGRWYKSKELHGNWVYVDPGSLPRSFAQIPEGSAKDIVLASVPGTEAAKEAVLDAQVPQTAKVERDKASTSVSYNGEPKFVSIDGTDLSYAVNTASTVLKEGGSFYAVDDGVWFVSNSAKGPWQVATSRPTDVDKIPPSVPVYNTKYVYIYDVTPSVVYMGYTPGYTGCYIAGPTVVFGTGYPYSPWYGGAYYPRPVTWGFGMSYNPWTGWSMGFGVSVGFFHFGFGYNFGGGWWGPPVYRPPFCYPYSHVYGPRPVVVNNVRINNFNNNVLNNRSGNIYNNRNDVISRNNRVGPGRNTGVVNRADRQGISNRAGQGIRDDIHVDQRGNIYKRTENGQWQQRQNNQWNAPGGNMNRQQLDRQFNERQRGRQQAQNFQRFQGNRGGMNRGGGFRRR